MSKPRLRSNHSLNFSKAEGPCKDEVLPVMLEKLVTAASKTSPFCLYA